MNKELRAALLAQVEARQALNGLAEDCSAEERTAAIAKLNDADQAVADLLAKEPSHAPAELRDRISLGRYIAGCASETVLDGAEGELRQELKLSDQAIPLEALLPTVEERADAVSPQDADGDPLAYGTINRTTGPMLSRVFTMTETAFLGVAMPTVPAGQRRYPVMVDGTEASMQARGAGPDAGAAKFDVVDASPKRLTGRYVFDLEGVAEMGGLLESTLRSDLRMEMGYQMDLQVLLGTGQNNQVTGILAQLPFSLQPGTEFAQNDSNEVLNWPLSKQLAYGSTDGRYIRTEADVRLLVGVTTYNLMREVYLESNNQIRDDQDGAMAFTSQGASLRKGYHIPAPSKITFPTKQAASKNHQAAILAGEVAAAVAPVWQGITMIRDPYTEAKGGQIVMTAHMLFDFVMRRKDGWRKYGIRVQT